jgi:hypothetical protein
MLKEFLLAMLYVFVIFPLIVWAAACMAVKIIERFLCRSKLQNACLRCSGITR